MKTDEYLYGKEVEVPEVPADIIVRRIELLNENLEELLKEDYRTRDTARVTAIVRAITFWENINGNNG
jgi:hypothetical protein